MILPAPRATTSAIVAIGLLAAFAAPHALAQSGPAAVVVPVPPSNSARDPLSLPADNLPPSLAAAVAPPRPAGTPRNEPVPPPAPALNLALKAIDAAMAACHAKGYEIGVAVANAEGGLVAGMQADQAHPGRVYNAMRKNLVALEFGKPSSAIRDALRAQDFGTLARVKPNMTLFPGAVPLFSGGNLIGAIGASGAPAGEIDESCAAAGADAIKAALG